MLQLEGRDFGRAGQGRAGQGRAGQGRAGQGRAACLEGEGVIRLICDIAKLVAAIMPLVHPQPPLQQTAPQLRFQNYLEILKT